ncbi:hypothetical protein FI615_001689 [Enterococcus faecium]|uniref:phage terminase large subunit n=1 Tax=Enterococcus faecium TaxID=1352 RepID=UPI0019205F86|nr:phage terminase large subunit [Enterococcus faecium]EGP4894203.1 hypothetical protein [Enterococcus faecium]EHK9936759.1 phage terminase large subunit [Enterococcus faecium]MBL3708351.1 hypothetical protein [Enterococcus faecium]
MNFDVNKDVISKHKPLFDRIANKNDIDNFVLSGGRSSFKSYDISLAIIIDILVHAEKDQQANAVVFMQKKEEIRDGVHKQVKIVIENLGLSSLFHINYTPFEICYKPNGSVVKFYGLNGQQGKKANAIDNISWIWFEECDQFDSAESIKATLDTLMRHNIQNEKIKVAYSFNPPKSQHHWIFNYINSIQGAHIHTTYLDDDTGKQLLSEQQIAMIETEKEADYAWYSWNYLGIVPKDTECDFPDIVNATEELELGENDYLFIGIDSATRGKDSTVACLVAYNTETLNIKLLGFQKFDDVWIDGYTSQVVGADIAAFARSVNANAVYVDPMQGQHIVDYLLINAPELTIQAINFGSRVSDKAKGKTALAKNRRAEMYLNVSEQLKAKRVVAYCDKNELERQLNATEFEMTAKEITVIKKDLIKERLGKSPDEADSFVLAIQAVYDLMRL